MIGGVSYEKLLLASTSYRRDPAVSSISAPAASNSGRSSLLGVTDIRESEGERHA